MTKVVGMAWVVICEDKTGLCCDSYGLDEAICGIFAGGFVAFDDERNEEPSERDTTLVDPATEENKDSVHVEMSENASFPRDKRGNPGDVNSLVFVEVAAPAEVAFCVWES